MAEFRAGNHQAHLTNGGCNNAAQSGARTTTTTRTNNSRRGILAISNGQTPTILAPSRENSTRQWRAGPGSSINSKPTGTSQFLQPPSNKHVGGNSSAELDLISGIETDTSFSNASRINRSSGHRRRHQELAN